MSTNYYIEKDRKLPASQDYEFLLKEGMKYVEKLGNKFWTDYNPHDPGISILEVLSYAITELGYRANFDIKDILAVKNGEIKNNTFFTAANIFTNAALTEIDYRKLLIDTEGVANAWFLPVKNEIKNGYFLPNDGETEIFINKLEDKLSLKNTDKHSKLLEKLSLRGLNKVKIELDEDPVLGDLNSMLFSFSFWKNNRWVNVEIIPHFTNWNDPDVRLFKLMNKPTKITIDSIKKMDDLVFMEVKRASKPADSLRFRIFSEDISELDLVLNHFNNEKNICEFISLFEQKRAKIIETFSKINIKLHQNRNLTEDFLCTEIVEKIDIGICADIELETGVDLVEVVSQIQIAIDKVINPKIYFYTLTQLVNDGFHSEDIFLGPKLTYGFLKDEEIENAQLPTEIHASDIIAVLMEINGVKSVKNFMMTAFNILGKPFPNAMNKSWVLKLPGDFKPVFNAKISKLLLFQKNIPFLLSENQQMLVNQKVILYKTQFNQKKLKDANFDFEIPTGNYFELDQYYSIQDDFPRNYGLGKNYISEKESDLRKAQVKQLKGYLYFYEQILADFFAQLYNAKDIFDTKTIGKTYFSKYLEKNDLSGEDFYSKELYNSNLQTVLLNGETPGNVNLYETKDAFFSRRNKILDHLLARFSESFNDYVFMMYSVASDTSGLGELSFDNEDLIQDKQNFLNIYPEISSNRGLGIDYINAKIVEDSLHLNPFWNSTLRGGYEKRVAKLLGINEISLRNIVTENLPAQTQWTVETTPEHFVFKILSPNVDLQEKWDWAQLHFLDQNLYKIDNYGPNFYLYLVKINKKIAKLDKKFSSEIEAFAYLTKMIKVLNIYYENFYCLEHILLRPFNNKSFKDEDLLTVCLQDDCDDEAGNDPYSFKATLVLPGYLSRFKSLVFRKYAEKVFRQEAPAHVLLKICWVNISDMLKFQKAYRNWMENYREYRLKFCKNRLSAQDEINYEKTLNNLAKAIKELNTIYPVGNLYNCQISETSNPLILGNSILGTL
ncbi:hypothetical protein SAMN05421847_2938 [Halpernia humi]|uniref:Uncharacterized protein n=1 Tax=Halpernia humi TaxID=493375 RepID=A0A1H6BJQ3_9FLAO|nr:hypothetical protein [Halpernia humi]SEG60923.1 hypothetical protein SAMN05421847_2938 [Halpernia humi]